MYLTTLFSASFTITSKADDRNVFPSGLPKVINIDRYVPNDLHILILGLSIGLKQQQQLTQAPPKSKDRDTEKKIMSLVEALICLHC